MKKLLVILAALTATFAVVKPAAAEGGQNNIGPSVVFGCKIIIKSYTFRGWKPQFIVEVFQLSRNKVVYFGCTIHLDRDNKVVYYLASFTLTKF